ncbi:MAG: hypothetical protein AB8E15_08250 [Bdellovibrionales bacterium]
MAEDTDSEIDQEIQLVERKLGCRPPYVYEIKLKVNRLLKNRGYSYDAIARVLNHE